VAEERKEGERKGQGRGRGRAMHLLRIPASYPRLAAAIPKERGKREERERKRERKGRSKPGTWVTKQTGDMGDTF
jgi:hypothetical protein